MMRQTHSLCGLNRTDFEILHEETLHVFPSIFLSREYLCLGLHKREGDGLYEQQRKINKYCVSSAPRHLFSPNTGSDNDIRSGSGNRRVTPTVSSLTNVRLCIKQHAEGAHENL